MAHRSATGKARQQYEVLRPLVDGLYVDMQKLASRKQEGAFSKNRIAMTNKLLKAVKDLLVDEPSSEFLELLDEELIPTNGDVLLILGQYRSAMEHFWNKYTTDDYGGRQWAE